MKANQYGILKLKAWILAGVFMLPIVLKVFHTHEEPVCCHIHHEADHDPNDDENAGTDDCAICHFTFSSFLSAETLATALITSVQSFYIPTFPQEIPSLRIHSNLLRAPPF